MILKLKKFQMSNICDDAVVTFIGKRRTGKSWLVRDLLYYHQDLPVGTVVSPTERCNKFFSNMVPPLFIHDEFQPSLIENVLKRQQKIIDKIERRDPDYTDADPRAFLLFDDCMYDASWARDKSVRFVFMNGRHLKILFLITMQYAMGIPPNLRNNIDFVFICRANTVAQQKRLYEQYAGMFPSLEMFAQVMNQCTENFECLVINNVTQSNQLEDQVFWYKAEPHDDIRIGADVFWNYNNMNYQEADPGLEEKTDWRNIGGRKNRIPIHVQKNTDLLGKKKSRAIRDKDEEEYDWDDIGSSVSSRGRRNKSGGMIDYTRFGYAEEDDIYD
jgi:hypothetical protein